MDVHPLILHFTLLSLPIISCILRLTQIRTEKLHNIYFTYLTTFLRNLDLNTDTSQRPCKRIAALFKFIKWKISLSITSIYSETAEQDFLSELRQA